MCLFILEKGAYHIRRAYQHLTDQVISFLQLDPTYRDLKSHRESEL